MVQNDDRRALRVLLVEDNAVNQMLAAARLKKAGHAVETAESGNEALAELAAAQNEPVAICAGRVGAIGRLMTASPPSRSAAATIRPVFDD
jgi:CheY-like chemotaxis protein